MESTLLVWLVLDLTDSPFRVSLVGVFAWLPLLTLGIVGGALADSVDRKRLFFWTLGINLVTVFAMAIMLAFGWIRVWYAYTSILITGTCYALGNASRRSLIHDIVGPKRLTNALALDNFGGNGSAMIGHALAGILITIGGVAAGYVVLTTLMCASLLFLWKLEAPYRKQRSISEAQIGSTLLTGLRYVRTQNALLATIIIAFVINLTVTHYENMTPVIAREFLHLSPSLRGILLSGHGLGALVGSLLVASAATIRYHGRIYMMGSLLLLVAVLFFSMSRSYALSLGIVIFAGLGNSGFNTMQMSLTMLLPRFEMRGAALGAMTLGIGAGPLGMLITGGVANLIGAPQAVTINALLGIACLALIALLAPTLRHQTISDTSINHSKG